MTEALIGRAIKLAYDAHRGQKDKLGIDYILHSLNVGMRGKTDHEIVVGILHDVVEDTDWTLERLSKLFPPDIVDAVDALSKRDDETYEEFIARTCESSDLAIKVKLNDIAENSRPDRPHPFAAGLLKRYRQAKISLEAAVCETCRYYKKHGGFSPTHEGSKSCRCGSIASGGTKAHCACSGCI